MPQCDRLRAYPGPPTLRRYPATGRVRAARRNAIQRMTESSQPPTVIDPTLRRIGQAGQWTLTCSVVLFLALGIRWPDPYAHVWKLVMFHLVAGRAGNVALGLELGFPHLFLFLQCFLEDIIIMLLFYPLVVAGYRRAVEWPLLGPALAKVRVTADRHKSRVEPFGALGLVVFVVFPFWSTGALAGAVVGYLIGMRTWVAFTSVMIGNAVAVASWVWFFDRISRINEHITKNFLIVLFVGVIVSAVVTQIRRLIRARRQTVYLAQMHQVDAHNGVNTQKDNEGVGQSRTRDNGPA